MSSIIGNYYIDYCHHSKAQILTLTNTDRMAIGPSKVFWMNSSI